MIADKSKQSIINYLDNLDDLETLNLYEKIRVYLNNQICFRIFSNSNIEYDHIQLLDTNDNEIDNNNVISIHEKEKFKKKNKKDIEFFRLVKSKFENEGLKFSIEFNGVFSQIINSNIIRSYIYYDEEDFNKHIEKANKYEVNISGKKMKMMKWWEN